METRTVIDKHARTTRNESVTRWSQSARLMLGAITLLLIVVFAAIAVGSIVAPGAIGLDGTGIQPVYYLLFIALFAQFLLIAIYLSFASQNPRTDGNLLWMLGMIFLPFATLPIYWWAHIWRAPYVGDRQHDHNVPGGQLTPQTD